MSVYLLKMKQKLRDQIPEWLALSEFMIYSGQISRECLDTNAILKCSKNRHIFNLN